LLQVELTWTAKMNPLTPVMERVSFKYTHAQSNSGHEQSSSKYNCTVYFAQYTLYNKGILRNLIKI
jgi:hypothetical protein